MGLIATLVKLTGAKIATKGNAPGKSAVATADGFDGQTLTTEVYQAPGVMGVPPDGSRGVLVPVGNSSRYTIVLACHNYQVTIEASAGETVIYSTTADGKTVKAQIKMDASGNIDLNGNGKRLVTWQEMQDALATLASKLTAHVHPSDGAVSPGLAGLTIDISAAKTQTVRTGG